MALGWWWDLYGCGGWCHTDVINNYGERIAFDTPDDVAEYIDANVEQEEKS